MRDLYHCESAGERICTLYADADEEPENICFFHPDDLPEMMNHAVVRKEDLLTYVGLLGDQGKIDIFLKAVCQNPDDDELIIALNDQELAGAAMGMINRKVINETQGMALFDIVRKVKANVINLADEYPSALLPFDLILLQFMITSESGRREQKRKMMKNLATKETFRSIKCFLS